MKRRTNNTERHQQPSKRTDRQLATVDAADALQRRERNQALNIKRFCVAAGICYSKGRELFRTPGFPAVSGLVFWRDYEDWRRIQNGLTQQTNGTLTQITHGKEETIGPSGRNLPPRATRILSEAETAILKNH